MTTKQIKEHQTKLLIKAAAFDKKQKQEFTITDVTPEGFGPTIKKGTNQNES